MKRKKEDDDEILVTSEERRQIYERMLLVFVIILPIIFTHKWFWLEDLSDINDDILAYGTLLIAFLGLRFIKRFTENTEGN